MKTVFAIMLIAIALFIRYHIGRRRFNRRGVAGLQHFRSYSHFVAVTTVEKILLIAGNLCGLAGLILLAVIVINHLKF